MKGKRFPKDPYRLREWKRVPKKVQKRIIEAFPPENPFPPGPDYRAALAGRSDLSEEVRDALLKRETDSYVLKVLVKRLAEEDDWEAFKALWTRHPDKRKGWVYTLGEANLASRLPKPVRAMFFQDPDPEVRKICATWPLDEAEELLLAQDPDPSVRKEIASRVTRRESFQLLLADEDESVRKESLWSPLVRKDLALFREVFSSLGERARTETAWAFSSHWEKTGRGEEFCRFLAADPSPRVRRASAASARSRELMERCLGDLPEVQRGLAMNKNLPEDLQLVLLDRGDPDVAVKLAANPALTREAARRILERYHDLFSQHPDSLKAVGKASSEALARFLFERRPTGHVLREVYEELAKRPEETPLVGRALEEFFPVYSEGYEEDRYVRRRKGGVRWIDTFLQLAPQLNPTFVRTVLSQGRDVPLRRLLGRKPFPESWFGILLEREEWSYAYTSFATTAPPAWFIEACFEKGFLRPLERLARSGHLSLDSLVKLLVAIHREEPEPKGFWERALGVAQRIRWIRWKASAPLPEHPGLTEALLALIEGDEASHVYWVLEFAPESLLERLPEATLMRLAHQALHWGGAGKILPRLEGRVHVEVLGI